MKSHLLLSASCVFLVLAPTLLPTATATPPSYFEDGDLPSDDDYVEDDELDRLLQNAQKRSSMVYLYRRSCVKRGGACDHRPEECCYNSTCRCNLWGANCRCQRKGLFQKWGRK
ncbi:uncharacterized protein LOC111056802 isoform X1 [Nilaparvata lugens]|uniref:uncharacterized protein LOC111056802 isoform X1 n=1 Tax=Nilaparvata lugens TaxID=108931 RepID=UPI000B9919B7|nr:uncharacterized protein LOC111056802 isoform X1 [Nilaparvata lugens]WJX09118.1 putative salivary protein [Nilaparvata lugens]